MHWRLNCLLIATVLSGRALATSGPANLCHLNQTVPEVISWLPEEPSYFAKIHPSGRWAFYIGEGNRILNVEESDPTQRVLSIPGGVDPVPCPDGRLVTVPGLSFFTLQSLMEKGPQATAFFEDSDHAGVYQSCAVLATTGNKTTYRIITDVDGTVQFRDYKVDWSNPQSPLVQPLKSVRARCPNLNLKTILISKTGKYLSGYDPQSGTTQIYAIRGTVEPCRLLVDLGYATGKLEFNANDTRIAFHVDTFFPEAGGYFSGVSSELTKDVFTLDLVETQTGLNVRNLRRLTVSRSKGSGSYYPSFLADGRVAFLNDDQNKFSFMIAHPEEASAFDMLLPPPTGWPHDRAPQHLPADWNKRLHAAAVVGSLWAKQCSPYDADLSAAEAAALRMNIPAETCRQLIEQGWNEDSANLLSQHVRFSRDTRFDSQLVKAFKQQELLRSCRDILPPKPRVPREYGTWVSTLNDGGRVIEHYCMSCHAVGKKLSLPDGSEIANTLDFRNLQEWQIKAALFRLAQPEGQGRMPPQGFAAPTAKHDHRKMAEDYLLCKLSQFDFSGPSYERPHCEGDLSKLAHHRGP